MTSTNTGPEERSNLAPSGDPSARSTGPAAAPSDHAPAGLRAGAARPRPRRRGRLGVEGAPRLDRHAGRRGRGDRRRPAGGGRRRGRRRGPRRVLRHPRLPQMGPRQGAARAGALRHRPDRLAHLQRDRARLPPRAVVSPAVRGVGQGPDLRRVGVVPVRRRVGKRGHQPLPATGGRRRPSHHGGRPRREPGDLGRLEHGLGAGPGGLRRPARSRRRADARFPGTRSPTTCAPSPRPTSSTPTRTSTTRVDIPGFPSSSRTGAPTSSSPTRTWGISRWCAAP